MKFFTVALPSINGKRECVSHSHAGAWWWAESLWKIGSKKKCCTALKFTPPVVCKMERGVAQHFSKRLIVKLRRASSLKWRSGWSHGLTGHWPEVRDVWPWDQPCLQRKIALLRPFWGSLLWIRQLWCYKERLCSTAVTWSKEGISNPRKKIVSKQKRSPQICPPHCLQHGARSCAAFLQTTDSEIAKGVLIEVEKWV